MVVEFRSTAGGYGTRADLTPRDQSLRRPLRVVTSGLDPRVTLNLNALSADSTALTVVSPDSVGRADAVLVQLPNWEAAANVDPAILPPEISFEVRQMPATEPAAFHAAERAGGTLTTFIVLNKGALATTTPFCIALMGHDFLRLWDGQAAFFTQFERLRVHDCVAWGWSSLPASVPSW
jgi:hypothetical protein